MTGPAVSARHVEETTVVYPLADKDKVVAALNGAGWFVLREGPLFIKGTEVRGMRKLVAQREDSGRSGNDIQEDVEFTLSKS